MSARNHEWERDIADEVARWPGADVDFGHASKHCVAVIAFGGQTRKVFYPTTPGDGRRGIYNKLKDVRRELRFLGAERISEKSAAGETERRHHNTVARPVKPGERVVREDRWIGPLAALRANMAGAA